LFHRLEMKRLNNIVGESYPSQVYTDDPPFYHAGSNGHYIEWYEQTGVTITNIWKQDYLLTLNFFQMNSDGSDIKVKSVKDLASEDVVGVNDGTVTHVKIKEEYLPSNYNSVKTRFGFDVIFGISSNNIETTYHFESTYYTVPATYPPNADKRLD
jgi:hypothetical protein